MLRPLKIIAMAALLSSSVPWACSSGDDTTPLGDDGWDTTTDTPSGTGGATTTSTSTFGVAGGGGAGGAGECIPGQATFAWQAPNMREDDSCLDNLAGFYLLYGEQSGDYTHRTDIPLDSAACVDGTEENECGFLQECSVTIVGLTPQLWFFALTAYDTDGVESAPSNEVSKDLSCPDER